MSESPATKTVTAIFDGRVLCPDDVLDLKPNVRYLITIAPQPEPSTDGGAWDVLERMAGTIEAPPDWAIEHDHYLQGTPKRTDA